MIMYKDVYNWEQPTGNGRVEGKPAIVKALQAGSTNQPVRLDILRQPQDDAGTRLDRSTRSGQKAFFI
jgi:hypothetical protein